MSSPSPQLRTPAADGSLLRDLNSSVRELRGALTEMITGLGADAKRPLSLGRALGVDKSLAWKISKMIKADDAGQAVQHLPGSAAFDILLAAVERRGATPRNVSRVRSAMKSVEQTVRDHVGDRPTLELILDGLPSDDRLLRSRKLAFRGTSGIWGVQAKTRVNTAIVAPSTGAPDLVDRAAIGGWIDFRRLRADTRWALFKRRFTTHLQSPASLEQPIDPDESPAGPMLIKKFCSPTLPPIQMIEDPDGALVHELGPSPVGNTGAFTAYFGSVLREIGSRYAAEPDDHGEFGAIISAPVETLQFDLIVHRSCQFAMNARVDVYGSLGPRHPRDLLPIEVKATQLGSFPPVVESPLVTGYGEILDYVIARCGWDRREFMGLRFILVYPPFPSTVLITFPLEGATAPPP